jgi:BirA family biotin operon repressor/biotin-[acetyl-CoA-carboxylase] ligase
MRHAGRMSALNFPEVERLLRTAQQGPRITYLSSTTSTMDEARGLAEAGAVHGSVVIAEEQTAGRGRFGRRWVSPVGKNLYLTLVLRPNVARLRTLAMVAPLAVCRAVGRVSRLRPVIKWPNDVQVDGRKLAGILIESELSGAEVTYALVGIGLNVNDPIADPEIAQIATSLARELGHDVSREEMLAALLAELEAVYESDDVYPGWRERVVTLGQSVRLTFRDKVYEGVAVDVDAEGSLVLRMTDGRLLTFEAGEVSLRAPGASA